MIRIVSIVEVVDDNCELIVEVGDNRCWPCKSNRGNPPLDTTDQLPSDIISAIETKIKINLKPKKCKTNPLLDTTDQLILDIISSAIIQIKTDVKPNTTIKITNLTNYPQMSET